MIETPVVLLHGQPGSARDWYRVLPLLSARRVVCPDRPGYDGTPATGFAGNASAVVELLDREGVDRAIVVGYSWGAGVALEVALAAPERVAALCLLTPVGVRAAYTVGDVVLAAPGVSAAFVAVMRVLGPSAARLLAWSSGSRLDGGGLAMLRAGLAVARRGPHWPAFAVEQRALVRETWLLEARLPAVRCPALVVGGLRDRYIPRTAVSDLVAALPAAEVRWVDAGHLLLLEDPAAAAAAIARAAQLGCGSCMRSR